MRAGFSSPPWESGTDSSFTTKNVIPYFFTTYHRFWGTALPRQEDWDLWWHRHRLWASGPVHTGSQKNHGLSMNEDKKILPVDPPEENRNRVANEWLEHQCVPNLGLSLDSHAPGRTGEKKNKYSCLHIKRHHSNDSRLKEKANVNIIQVLEEINVKEGKTCRMYLKRRHHVDGGSVKWLSVMVNCSLYERVKR